MYVSLIDLAVAKSGNTVSSSLICIFCATGDWLIWAGVVWGLVAVTLEGCRTPQSHPSLSWQRILRTPQVWPIFLCFSFSWQKVLVYFQFISILFKWKFHSNDNRLFCLFLSSKKRGEIEEGLGGKLVAFIWIKKFAYEKIALYKAVICHSDDIRMNFLSHVMKGFTD